MSLKNCSPLNKLVVSAISLLPLFSESIFAETLISRDGREVILNEDGSWNYLSEDVLLETKDGYTVRLKPDNTWEYLGNAPIKKDDRHRELDVDIELVDVFINETMNKAGSASKNKRRDAEIQFEVRISLTPNSDLYLDLAGLNKKDFQITDNRGKKYDISSFSATKARIQSGGEAILSIKTDSAPSVLYKPKAIYLDISGDTLETTEDVRLERLFATIKRNRLSD